MNRTIKSIATGCIGGLAILAGENLCSPKPPEQVTAETTAATVILEIKDEGGTGWFMDDHGDIVSSYRVVNSLDKKITVILSDKSRHEAKVVRESQATDITILHIDKISGHTFLKLADSDKVVTGNRVTEVGYPFQLGLAASQGTISAPKTTYKNVNYVQFDAATNMGSIGGPVVNKEGKLVGMSDVMITGTNENAGVNLALPSNTIKKQLQAWGFQ